MIEARPLRVGYLMSWYPAVTETFILHEMLELRRLGADVQIYPLLGAAQDVGHPGAAELAPRVHYHRALSLELVAAQLHWLVRRPRAYLRTWIDAVRGNARSPEFLAKALVVVPRAAVIARRLERDGVEHVHAHWATHPALAAYVIARLTGVGYSFTAHAHDLYLDRSMLAAKIAGARFVATISRFNRALIARLFGAAAAAKTVVVPCGVDPRLFAPRTPREPDGALRVACVAGLRDYKGHRFLVQACALLRERGVPFDCVLVGDGPERGAVEAEIAAAGLEGQVRVVGNMPQHEMRAVLDRSDVMVLPSVVTPDGMMDGIPVALMEAMAIELPVVSTRVSGIPELVEDGRTGLLVPEKDGRALAGALERLHRDPALARRLGAAGRARVLERFNLVTNVRRLHAHLEAAARPQALVAPERRRPRAARVPSTARGRGAAPPSSGATAPRPGAPPGAA
jgi:glycosyltransferase involved in cell wall biosynthesis